jgi:hypothetical protein
MVNTAVHKLPIDRARYGKWALWSALVRQLGG